MGNRTEIIQLEGIITEEQAGERLDKATARLFPDYSRSMIQTWIKDKKVTLNDHFAQIKEIVKIGDKISIQATLVSEVTWEGQPIDLNIVFEDEDLLIINKPAGLVVHPAAGNPHSTLVNALLHHIPALEQIPRAGIIHRLDKDTSGLLAVPKTLEAHTHLVRQIHRREFQRIYEAITHNVMTAGGTVDAPLGRHPQKRTSMAVVANGKPSVTHYRVLERFAQHSHIQVTLETGRTHQIRVHMAHIHYPLLGDALYGGRARLPKGASPELLEALQHFKRQALHAKTLGLVHPRTQEFLKWEAPLPDDMKNLLTLLRQTP